MSTEQREKKENEFGLQTLPTFSPFQVTKIEAVAVKIKTGARAGQEFNMYDVTVSPNKFVGKNAIFRFNSTTLDRLRAILYIAGKNALINCDWSNEQKAPQFSAQLK